MLQQKLQLEGNFKQQITENFKTNKCLMSRQKMFCNIILTQNISTVMTFLSSQIETTIIDLEPQFTIEQLQIKYIYMSQQMW